MSFTDILSHVFGRHAEPLAPEPPRPIAISIDAKLSEDDNIKNIQRALDSGTGVNEKQWANQSPLCTAAGLGMQKVAAFLIDHGAPVNPPAGDHTPFMEAAEHFQLDMMKFLVSSGADPKQPDSIPQDAMTKYMLVHPWERKDDPDFPALDRACMQYLLDQGLAFPDWVRSTIYTERKALAPFMPDYGDVRKMEDAAKNGDKATVRLLISNGVHPDEPARCGGRSPMDYAIEKDDASEVRYLLQHGADVEQWSACMTPIMRAASSGAKAAFVELLRAGADTTKEYTSDRYPDTTIAELAQQCKTAPDMKAFVESTIANRSNLPPPPVDPEPEVTVEHQIKVGHSLRLKPMGMA